MRCGPCREAIEATAAFRDVDLTTLARATQGLARIRSATYSAYRSGIGGPGERLPDEFQDVIDACAAFVDPVLSGLDVDARWDPQSRLWSLR